MTIAREVEVYCQETNTYYINPSAVGGVSHPVRKVVKQSWIDYLFCQPKEEYWYFTFTLQGQVNYVYQDSKEAIFCEYRKLKPEDSITLFSEG